jgi:hypothetical protein
MRLDTKITANLVDAGLMVGLIVALGTVYIVEARRQNPAANKVTEDEPHVVEPEKAPLSHGAARKLNADNAGMAQVHESATSRPEAEKPTDNAGANVAAHASSSPPRKANTPAGNLAANVKSPASAAPPPVANIESSLTGATPRLAPKDSEPVLGTYINRTKKDKPQWIGHYGGSPESEACVQEGLNWLARHQAADGFWSSECLGPKQTFAHSRCEKSGLCAIPGMNYVMAQTGLALLALQAAGNYECNEEKYSTHVRRGLNWLIHYQRRDGALVGPLSIEPANYGHSFMYEHAMAAFALAEACAVRRAMRKKDAPLLRRAAQGAIAFIERQQHDDGGWRYTNYSTETSDCSVSGWAMLALKSARAADIPVSQKTLERTRNFFQSCETNDGRTGYQRGTGGSDAVTAVGMLTHLLLLQDPEAPLVDTSATHLADQAERYRASILSGATEFYTLYNATLAMYLTGGPRWDRWNKAIRDAVVVKQDRGPGCQRGSWDPSRTIGGHQGGRIYSTALATLTLEVYYRFARDEKGDARNPPTPKSR